MVLHFIFILFLISFCNANLVIENDVFSSPEVHCNVDSINVLFKTQKPFTGRVYVDGESYDKSCIKNFAELEAGNGLDTLEGFEFRIPFGACNMRRQRTLSPRGVAFSFSVIVSFHPLFITSNDKAFKVKCFFMEAVKAVDAGIEVNKLTTQLVENTFRLPQCSYSLRHSIDGAPLDFANVGQPVTHVWQCDQIAGYVYGMLIHSCFVDDGNGNKFELVDNKGCAVDHYLLSDLQYDPVTFTAYSNTHVFKYADRVQLFFTCTVQLCFKDDGGCNGITPPTCTSKGFIPGIVELGLNKDDSYKSDIKPPLAHINLPDAEVKPFFANSLPPTKGIDNERLPKQEIEIPPTHSSEIPSFEEFKARVLRPPSPNRLPTSFKDSPIMLAENTTTVDSKTMDLKIFNATTKPKRSPLSKGYDKNNYISDSKTPLNNMEADLSVSLTVLPITNPTPSYEKIKLHEEKLNNVREEGKNFCISHISIILFILSEFFSIAITVTITIAFLLKQRKDKIKESRIEAFN
uniref:ZP domain-containing protein n=1 Tax=Parastrongyloides trichosuri TaxID=131310 RepID=A0A0N4ZPR7_PARTI